MLFSASNSLWILYIWVTALLLRHRKPPTEDLPEALAFLVTLPSACLSAALWRLHTVMCGGHNSAIGHCAFPATTHPIILGVIRLEINQSLGRKLKTRVTEYRFHVRRVKGRIVKNQAGVCSTSKPAGLNRNRLGVWPGVARIGDAFYFSTLVSGP